MCGRVYGQKFTSTLSETNLPMYIQIKDFANMRLYDMVKAMGGELAYRKVDCAVTVGGALLPRLSDAWGGYRTSIPPKHLGETIVMPLCPEPVERPWTVLDVHDSEDWQAMLKAAQDKGGLMIQGRAGTGKSYAAVQIARALEAQGSKVAKVAFTNKAALNIGGKTIHKFLRIGRDKRISVTSIKGRVQCVIVDEISMIPRDIWRSLVELKRAAPAIRFILVGDYRQCKPVEKHEERIKNYFDHPAVKMLAGYTKVDLTVRHRYDERLWDLLENVNGVDTATFGSKVCERNICFYNHTRKTVNEMLMQRNKPSTATFLPVPPPVAKTAEEAAKAAAKKAADPDWEDKEDEHPQDAWLYTGLPVIARRTINDSKNPDMMVNNEYFTVTRVGDGTVSAVSTRPGEEGEGPQEHSITIPFDQFHKLFCVNCCSTTHKAQGETILEEFTLWDWAKMSTELRYTAMSRAKTPDQIHFAGTTL